MHVLVCVAHIHVAVCTELRGCPYHSPQTCLMSLPQSPDLGEFHYLSPQTCVMSLPQSHVGGLFSCLSCGQGARGGAPSTPVALQHGVPWDLVGGAGRNGYDVMVRG